MASVKHVLERILRNQYDFCCLCFNCFRQSDKFYHIHDEIIFKNKNTKSLFEILSLLIGPKVLDNHTDAISVCYTCTEMAIKSYNFVMDCRRRSEHFVSILNTLYNYFKYHDQEVKACNTLILTLISCGNQDYLVDSKLKGPESETLNDHTTEDSVLVNHPLITNIKSEAKIVIVPDVGNDNEEHSQDVILKEVNANKSPIFRLNSNDYKDYDSNSELSGKPMDILNNHTGPVNKNIPLITDIKSEDNIDIHVNIPDEKNNNKEHELTGAIKLTDIIFDKNNLKLFKCKSCHKTYPRAFNLKRHYSCVHAPKNFKCSVCAKSFGSPMLLKIHHNRLHHGPACCTKCGKMFKSKFLLESHEKRHIMSMSTCICQHCGKKYKTKQGLKRHINEFHINLEINKPHFICDYCGKKFTQKGALRVHIPFKHGNGKFYECGWCKKKLSSASHLKEHTITHTQEKRFGCEICGGRFVTKMSLLYHTRTHTGETPYQCQHCDKRFLSASRRMMHVRRNHLPATQECDVCHKKFKERSSLLRHRIRHFNPGSRLHQTTE